MTADEAYWEWVKLKSRFDGPGDRDAFVEVVDRLSAALRQRVRELEAEIAVLKKARP